MSDLATIPDLLGTSPADLIDAVADRPVATTHDARQRAERVRAGLDSYTRMRQDIADAYACRDWLALGYSTWFAYLDGEYGPELRRLSRDERPAAVRDLRTQGMSTRAIADVIGASEATVRRDLSTASNDAVELPETVVGLDGKERPATRPAPAPPVEPDLFEWRCARCRLHFEAATNVCPDCGWFAVGDVTEDHPPRVGEADARLDAAVGPAASEAPTGVCGTPGAGDSSPTPPVATPVAALPHTHPEGSGPTPPEVGQPSGDGRPASGPDPERPRPPAWDPAERAAHEDEVRRVQMIDAARRTAKTIVTTVLAEVTTVVGGCRLGETGLVTRDMIAKLREAIDLLEGEITDEG